MCFTSSSDGLYSQAEDGLHGDEESRNVEGLEENLGRLLPVLAGVERSFGQQDRMLPNTKMNKEHGDRLFPDQTGDLCHHAAETDRERGALTSSEKVCSCSLE